MSGLFAATPAFIIRWLGAKLAAPAPAARVAFSIGRNALRARRAPRRLGRAVLRAPCAGVCAGLLLLSLTQPACGGDDSDSAPQSQGAKDAGAMPQRAAPAPTATSGTEASVTVSGASLDPPLLCGQAECSQPKNVAAQLLMGITGLPKTGAETVACCLDEAGGICSSAASAGASCDTVAVADERCPGVDLSALSDLVGGLADSAAEARVGCCTHDACGLDGKLFGRGCVENADAKRMLSAVPVIGPLIVVPAPRACAAGPADAGTGKSGSKPTDAGKPNPASDQDAGA